MIRSNSEYVASLNRPNGNITGISLLFNMLAAKHLELLHEMVPKAGSVGMLVNPSNPNAAVDSREVEIAANVLGQKLVVVRASTPADIDAAFVTLAEQRIDALFLHADAYFASRYQQLAALTVRYVIPTIFYVRDFVAAGGLMSYGPQHCRCLPPGGRVLWPNSQWRKAWRTARGAVSESRVGD